MGLAALDVGNKADPAGILFVRRVEQAERLRAHRHSSRSPRCGPWPAPRFRHIVSSRRTLIQRARASHQSSWRQPLCRLTALAACFCRHPTRPRPRRLAFARLSPNLFPHPITEEGGEGGARYWPPNWDSNAVLYGTWQTPGVSTSLKPGARSLRYGLAVLGPFPRDVCRPSGPREAHRCNGRGARR